MLRKALDIMLSSIFLAVLNSLISRFLVFHNCNKFFHSCGSYYGLADLQTSQE